MREETHLPTNELAKMLGVTSATIRRGYCVNGHYMNMRPVKLPNGRLLWPEVDLKTLLRKEA